MALAGCKSRPKQSRPGDPIILLLNPVQMAYLPIFYALDHGYFAAEGLNIQLKLYTGSANAQLPLLARGDVDVGGVIAAPALFNQAAAGFGIQLLAALTEPREGYLDAVNVMMREDVWQKGSVKTLADLRGHTIDGAAQGNPIDLLIRCALLEAKLGLDDVDLSYKIRSPSDVPYLFREKQVDFAGVSEPTATFILKRGLARKWLGYYQVLPWFQDTFLGASEDFIRDRPKEVRAMLRAYLRAVETIDRSKGTWTPEAVSTMAKWSKLKADDIKSVGRLPYWSPSGIVDASALARVQDFWSERRLVRDRTDISFLVGRQHAAAT
jgi:ABC-type nitrate/sulfonate/bicarbonate transport system substrate-binding protein